METRSSPSLQVLQGLAKQAHMGPEDLTILSKPALYGHLRANYDYGRLERAHQIAMKRREGGTEGRNGDGSSASSNNDDESSAPRSKRPCRVIDPSSGGGASSTSPISSPRASSAASRCDAPQALPPASIFVQTRSRTRMLAAASAGGSSAEVHSTASLTASGLTTTGARSRASTGSIVRHQAKKEPAAPGRAHSLSSRPRAGSRRASQLKVTSQGTGASSGKQNRGRSSSVGSSSARAGIRSGASSGGASSCDAGAEGSDGVEVVAGASDGSSGSSELSSTRESTSTRKRKASAAHADASSTASSGRGRAKGKGKGKGKGKAKAEPGGRGGSRSRARSSGESTSDAGGIHGRDGGVVEGKSEIPVASVGDCKGESAGGGSGAENELDPIMLVKVGKYHHRFVRPNGRVVRYNLDSLVDYFISTGDFLEPETRLPFSDEELRIIDSKVKAAGLSKPSVLEAKRDPGRYTQRKFQQDALVGLERMTSELVTGMLAVVEESDREEGEIRLVTELFPPFADLFKQIRAADKAFAVQCMQHYISWLQGPPNRPTEDEMGFLEIILGFLKQLQECDGSSALGF